MVGAAAAAEDTQVGEPRREGAVFASELLRVAAVELGVGVEFLVAAARGVGANAADALQPGALVAQLGLEMAGMGAVDHHVLGGRIGLRVDSFDRLPKRLFT